MRTPDPPAAGGAVNGGAIRSALRPARVGALLLVLLAGGSVYGCVHAGRFLVREDPLSPADAILARGSRYDEVTPGRWWQRRSDIRWVVSELVKLAAYALGIQP